MNDFSNTSVNGQRVYMLRHCQTVDNENNINGSRNDSPLSSNGLLIADSLVEKLNAYKFDVIILSPLRRTFQTIEPYLNNLAIKPPIYTEPLTIERDLGKLTGTISGDGSVKESIYASGKSQTEWIPPEGESTVMVSERASLFLNKLRQMPYKNILICGHQNFLRCLELLIKNQQINDENFFSTLIPKLDNGEIREYAI